MSNIPTVPGIDNEKLTKLARSLLRQGTDPDDLKLLKAMQVVLPDEVGDPGVPATFSFDELEGLINILDTSRPLKAKMDPSQWVVLTYQLEDLERYLEFDWRITSYQLHVNARTKTLKFSGTIAHVFAIPGHPRYGEGTPQPPKEFEFSMDDFEMIQQIALSRVIAATDYKFDPVAGTFDVSYLYKFSSQGCSFATLDIP